MIWIIWTGISNKWLETIQRKKDESLTGKSITADSRGKHTNKENSNKVKPEVTDSVRKHIESFNKVESQYCRSTSHRQYLSSDMSINKMYRMYTTNMANTQQTAIATKHHYRDIFCNEYNLSSHKPKKDQCDVCAAFNNLSSQEKKDAQTE